MSDGAAAGSEFVVRLLIVPQDFVGASPPSNQTTERVHELRILVIDDNVDAGERLRRDLELEGHEVKTAYSGSAAVQALESFQPQVILLDPGMRAVSGFDRHLPKPLDLKLLGQALGDLEGN